MGELLSFPNRRSDSAEAPVEGFQESGAERRSAPSSRPWRQAPPPRQVDSDEDPYPDDDTAPVEDTVPVEEPGWTVPGVDGSEPVRPEPTRRSQRAEHVAIATLTRHDASEGEIRAKLVAAGVELEAVEAELDRLRRVGLIDDTAFAVRLVDRLRERKGLGDSAIRSTLRGRLVPQSVVDAVLVDQAEDEETAEARLQEVADDRARRLTSLSYAVAERRLSAYLMRKGYSGSGVRTAVRTALDGVGLR